MQAQRRLLSSNVVMLDGDVDTSGSVPHEEQASDSLSVSTSNPALPYVPAFKHHDVVYGTVLFSNPRGSRTSVMYHDGLLGHMPVDQCPLLPEEWSGFNTASLSTHRRQIGQEHAHRIPVASHMQLDVGVVRPFKVISVPQDMQIGGRGPLLSAYQYDRDMLWARISQFYELCVEDNLVFKVRVKSSNQGGLNVSFMVPLGLNGFVPKSHISRRPGLDVHEAVESLIGTDIEVSMLQMEPYKSIKMSEINASYNKLKPGNVILGRVSKVTASAAFVSVQGMDVDAIIFRAFISSDVPQHPQEVLETGEFVYAVVTECNDNKVRLSTHLLEQEYGEMRRSKQAVFQRAATGPKAVKLPPARELMRMARQHSGVRTTDNYSDNQQGAPIRYDRFKESSWREDRYEERRSNSPQFDNSFDENDQGNGGHSEGRSGERYHDHGHGSGRGGSTERFSDSRSRRRSTSRW
ncbi:hypothetical protein CEUSTIGMA_g13016.t1 [Chlamydomonas eustigma]|uniref:S1 motif domain-containing protein n=1 Tax=Chlamydomonas eustigma TaxID=1157962 RepID=A0A250XR87_9CHLO|nr:hypothetical protein CEUSTIGMA_g13016.t1 [Chlamydomonas eustigma]|eukprot:GAX85601.1 hypothetical protein CEUSTIGMA_g13016.t1 [Chlamydomonas eustigma]